MAKKAALALPEPQRQALLVPSLFPLVEAQAASPLMCMAGELRNRIYRSALSEDECDIKNPSHLKNVRALLQVCRAIRYEAWSIFTNETTLRVDLADNSFHGGEDADLVFNKSYNTQVDLRLSIPSNRWYALLSKHAWIATQPTHDGHWAKVAVNTDTFGFLHGADLPSLTFNIGVGSIGGVLFDETSLFDRQLDNKRLRNTMLTYRSHRAQLTELERSSTVNEQIEQHGEPSEVLRRCYRTQEGFEHWCKFHVLVCLGNVAHKLGGTVKLGDSKKKRWLEWAISDKENNVGGADIKDLYLLANYLEDDGSGLWLASE